jgi:hypothetical protein
VSSSSSCPSTSTTIRRSSVSRWPSGSSGSRSSWTSSDRATEQSFLDTPTGRLELASPGTSMLACSTTSRDIFTFTDGTSGTVEKRTNVSSQENERGVNGEYVTSELSRACHAPCHAHVTGICHATTKNYIQGRVRSRLRILASLVIESLRAYAFLPWSVRARLA